MAVGIATSSGNPLADYFIDGCICHIDEEKKTLAVIPWNSDEQSYDNDATVSMRYNKKTLFPKIQTEFRQLIGHKATLHGVKEEMTLLSKK